MYLVFRKYILLVGIAPPMPPSRNTSQFRPAPRYFRDVKPAAALSSEVTRWIAWRDSR
ncbi:hypothetical protein D3C86_1894300 [compost metagenome]